MKKLTGCIVCFGLSAFVAVAQDGPTTLEGNWTAIAGIIEGKKLPEDEVKKAALIVNFTKDGKYTVISMGKKIESGTYKLDAKAKPATIDLTITEGKDKDKTQFGIYKLEGDQVSFAIASVDIKTRPTNFDGGKDAEVTILKRNK
jgi:uncharacterized protein (TIGR03067 family)